MAATMIKSTTVSPQQYAGMTPAQQQAYLRTLPADQQQALVQAATSLTTNANRQFMQKSIRKLAPCPNASGAGYSQTYAPGATLVWDLPVIAGGVAAELLIVYNVLVNPATGTGAAYAANASAPYSLFQEVDVTYNGTQVRTLAYFLKLMSMLRGFQRSGPGLVIAGQSLTNVQNYTNTGAPLTVGSNNTWAGVLRIPLNAIAKDDFRGVLPINAQGTKPQLKVQCAQQLLGPDPLLCPIATTGGSGAAITIAAGSTVKAYVEYLDGTTYDSLQNLGLNLTGQPTVQYAWDQSLNPLSANLIQRQRIVSLKRHAYVVSIIIDGQQSTKFATIPNILGLQLAMDDSGQNAFKAVGLQTNTDVQLYFEQLRQLLGQDLDEGVILWVGGPLDGVQNPSSHLGPKLLDMTPGHWTAATHAYQVSAVGGVTGITPRVETFVVYINDGGFAST
jgi:hypothetical protein